MDNSQISKSIETLLTDVKEMWDGKKTPHAQIIGYMEGYLKTIKNEINSKSPKTEKIYVVESRDKGVIVGTKNLELVDTLVSEQTKFEEMAGGRPGVYYKEIEIINK